MGGQGVQGRALQTFTKKNVHVIAKHRRVRMFSSENLNEKLKKYERRKIEMNVE